MSNPTEKRNAKAIDSDEIARRALLLRDEITSFSTNAQFGFPFLWIYGRDSRYLPGGEHFNDDAGDQHFEIANRYNGILAQTRGFVAQFKMNFTPDGATDSIPLILTVASYDPQNLGTYNKDRKCFILGEEDIKNRTYLLSARPSTAPLGLFQKDILDHFDIFQKLDRDLNLLGRRISIRHKGKKLYFGQYLSKHVTYALIQLPTESDASKEYVILRRYGPGRLQQDSQTYYPIDPNEVEMERLLQGRCPPRTEFVTHQSADSHRFPNTQIANAHILTDFGERSRNLWNMKHASGGALSNQLSKLKDKHMRGGLLTATFSFVVGAMGFGAIELFSSGGQFGLTTVIAALLGGAVAAASEIYEDALIMRIRRLGEYVFSERIRNAEISLQEKAYRDYAEFLIRPEDGPNGKRRLAKKIDPRFANQAERLFAIDDNSKTATSIHLPVDPLTATDPAEEATCPESLFLANPTGGIMGNLERFIGRHTVLTVSPSRLSIIKAIEPINGNGSEFAKTNIVNVFVAFTGQLNHALPLEDADVGTATEAAQGPTSNPDTRFESLAESLGLEKQTRDGPTLLFGSLDSRLLKDKCIAHIQFNRFFSKFKIRYIPAGVWQKDFLPRLPIFVRAAPGERIFQGLGYGADACQRIQAAMGIRRQDVLSYDELQERRRAIIDEAGPQ